MNINVIFKTRAKWEFDWLNEIFFSSDRFSFSFKDRGFVGPNSIIVTDNPTMNLFDGHIKEQKDFILINLKDEFLPSKQDLSIYNSKYCKYIFRNYFHEDFSQKNLTAFPLGYKNEFWKGYTSDEKLNAQYNNDRKYVWSFAGTAKKSGRNKTISKLSSLKPNHLHEISFWDAPESLNATEYRDLILDSHFIPSFRGNANLECYRTYEALEAGALPLVQRFSHLQKYDLYNAWYKDNPLLLIDDIGKGDSYKAECSNQAYDTIDFYIKNKDSLSDLRKKTLDWWISYKENLKTKAYNTYEEVFKA